MPSKKDKTPIEEGGYYHIFNRGINGERLFQSPLHYSKFLNFYSHYMSDFVNTYAYCVLPNHFHFLVQIKDRNEYFGLSTPSNQFRKLFIKYALYFNHQTNRYGNLFCKNFKRLQVKDDEYLRQLVFYIHSNPRKHRLISDYRNYRYSSFDEIIRGDNRLVDSETTCSWFNSTSELVDFHDYKTNEMILNWLAIEDVFC